MLTGSASQALAGGRAETATRPTALRPVWDALRVGLVVLLVLNVSRIHQHFGFLAALRPAVLLTAGVVGIVVLNPGLLAGSRVLRTWPCKVMAWLGVAACLSVPFAISLGHSAVFVLQSYWKVLFGAFFLALAIRTARDLYTFVWGMVIASGALAWLALFVFTMAQAGGDGGIARLSDGYTYDANDVGCVATVGMALTLLTFQTSGRLGRIVSFVVLLALAMTIAKTGSRGAFLGVMALGVALLVLLRTIPVAKRLGFVVVAAVAIGLAAPPGYWDQMLTVTKPADDYNWTSPTGRKAVAKRGIGYMLKNPVTGLGIDNFGFAEGTISERVRNFREGDEGIKWSAAHNSFVQVGAELGFPGLVLFSVLAFGGIVAPVRLRRRLPSSWANGPPEDRFLYYICTYLPVAFTGFIVTGFFLSFAYMDLVYILAALLAGTYTSVAERLSRGDSAPVPVAARYRGGLPPVSRADMHSSMRA